MLLHSAVSVFFSTSSSWSQLSSHWHQKQWILVYAFVSSRIDYCNSVFTDISGQLLQWLQATQNAAARLITGPEDLNSDTDTASIALVTMAAYSFKDGRVGVQVSARYGSVLPVDILHPNVITWRSVSPSLCRIWTTRLSVPRTTTNYGDRSFAVSGPVVWNSLPAALRLDMSLSVFRRRLKTFFMTEATDSVWQLTWHICCISFLRTCAI